MRRKKVKPIHKLGKFQLGQIVWYIRFQNNISKDMHAYIGLNGTIIDNDWELDNPNDLHPKDQFIIDNKPGWPKGIKLPRLPSIDFYMYTYALLSELMVYEMEVKKINRSNNTGEFYYKCKDTWLPESSIFETKQAAWLELNRLKKLLKKHMS